MHAFYLYDDGECVAREYDVPFEGKARRVSDMRTGRELVFVQNGGTITVQSDGERVGEKGDIADCFVIEV